MNSWWVQNSRNLCDLRGGTEISSQKSYLIAKINFKDHCKIKIIAS